MLRRRVLFSGFFFFFLNVNTAPAEVELPSGRLAFETMSFGVIVGYRRGQGVLTFNEQEYPFTVKGFTLLDVGGSRLNAIGVVYNLTRLSDFEGSYFGVQGGLTAIQGGGSAIMNNEHGVRIQLDTLQQGIQVNLGGGGFRIELDDNVALGDADATIGDVSEK